LRSLISKWEDSFEAIANGKPPKLLFNERSRTTTILRDLLNDSFTNIVVNDKEVYQEILSYISTIMPDQKDIVKYYKGNTPIFDAYDLTKQIKGSFGKVVPIKQGAYIVIEHTEALNVVDVNSGIRAKTAEQEENSFIVNMHAADEIARQMRLRDIGGIVIVDFIDMDDNDHKVALYKHMQELMANDRAKHNVLPLTKFGLMQITRQRVRPATEIKVNEKCPMCHGTGEIAPTILADEALERELAYYVKERHITSFILKLNPVLEAYITKGFFNSIKRKWCKKYKCAIKTESVSDFMLMQSQWCNSKGEVLED
jgi:ribonuclease G